MADKTVAVLMPGDMGHAVGSALRHHGLDVVTCLAGRGDHTRRLSEKAGLRDLGDLDAVVGEAGLVLSILPPAAALDQARAVAGAMTRTGRTPVYVDCNAVAPASAAEIAAVVEAAGAPFIDAGIIGIRPALDGGGPGPRIHVSGADVAPMLALDGKGFRVLPVAGGVGRASALKMCYAGLTKGTWTLHTAVLLAAEAEGLLQPLLEEFRDSQGQALALMEARIPRLPADSGRWIGEMEEIAKTFRDAGVTPGFHEGAAAVFRLLAATPFAAETRETIDADRSMADTVRAAAKLLGGDGD